MHLSKYLKGLLPHILNNCLLEMFCIEVNHFRIEEKPEERVREPPQTKGYLSKGTIE
jgi:hypothetical protein